MDGGEESRDSEGATVANPDQPYIDWILAAFARPGTPEKPRKTQVGLAKALGVGQAQISRMINGKRRLKHWEISKAAEYLEELPPLVQVSTASPLAAESLTVKYAPVRGECAGGRWMEYEVGDDTYETIPIVPTRFSALEQFAFRVRGNSMDKAKILDGDYVICVPYFDARAGLTHGDTVVVERRRGGLYERTCKRLELRPDGVVALISQSSDPHNAEPLLQLRVNGHADDGVEIEVTGLVIGRYAPI
jgi:SOS-response transcriptional repressor LexA